MLGTFANPISLRSLIAISGFMLFLCRGTLATQLKADENSKLEAKNSESIVGHAVSAPGALLRREVSKKSWSIIRSNENLSSGDMLLVLPGDRGTIETKNGALGLTLWGVLPDLAALPVLESAVAINANSKSHLDFTLQRGRVLLTGLSDKVGHARVRFQGNAWELDIPAKAAVAVELFSRWAPGSSFTRKPSPEEVPTTALILHILKGQIDLRGSGVQHSLQEPPGPAYFHWDSIGGADEGPKRRERIPRWAEEKRQTKADPSIGSLNGWHKKFIDHPVIEVLKDALEGDVDARDLAVYSLGATDDIKHLFTALSSKHADVRDAAVRALQHWIGRQRGNDAVLYDFLTTEMTYTPRQADTVGQLLHGFSGTDRQRPETYETLIAYLRNSQPAVRQLAKWYLYQWIPVAKTIAYNPVGTGEERDAAYKKWKEIIPDGQLPPKAK